MRRWPAPRPASRSCSAPLLTGRDADDLVARCAEVQRAVAGNEAAKAAVDVALHDLAARRLGVPLVRLLGGTALRVPTDVTLAAGDAADLAAAARQRRADGFGVLKMKVGTDAAADVARVRAVRAAVGAGRADPARRQPGLDARARRSG